MNNRTFTIIKPNAIGAGNTGKIIDHLIREGFKIRAMKYICLSRNQAEKFYDVHRGKPFFPSLVDFMTSGPIVVAVLERENAVAELRRVVGNTDPAKAAEGTIRRLYGEDVQHNAIHASDSDENAAIEAARFFSDDEIIIVDYND